MNIFVGCSARDINNEAYDKVAEEIGMYISKAKHNFIFGGCKTGLMGKIYSTVLDKGKQSKIIVNIAKAYEKDLEGIIYDEAYMFETVNERKNAFIKTADVMMYIPGGIGTIDELLNSIETRRNHEHNAPIIIINVNHFFDDILKMLNRIYDEGLANTKDSQLYQVVDNVDEAINLLELIEE